MSETSDLSSDSWKKIICLVWCIAVFPTDLSLFLSCSPYGMKLTRSLMLVFLRPDGASSLNKFPDSSSYPAIIILSNHFKIYPNIYTSAWLPTQIWLVLNVMYICHISHQYAWCLKNNTGYAKFSHNADLLRTSLLVLRCVFVPIGIIFEGVDISNKCHITAMPIYVTSWFKIVYKHLIEMARSMSYILQKIYKRICIRKIMKSKMKTTRHHTRYKHLWPAVY